MVSVKNRGRKIDFVGNCMTELSEYFFVIILNFILKPFIDTKFLKNNFLPWKISFSKADLEFLHIAERQIECF